MSDGQVEYIIRRKDIFGLEVRRSFFISYKVVLKDENRNNKSVESNNDTQTNIEFVNDNENKSLVGTVDGKKENNNIDANTSSEDEKSPYYMKVNRVLNVVTIYKKDVNGKYTIPDRAFVCSTGQDLATPLGVYSTYDKYRWLTLFGPCYGQYAARFNGHILFHSIPYYTQNPSDLEFEEFPLLGESVSMGCVRLCVRDAKWIFDNCPFGTTVEVYDDNNPGPLGKPDVPYYDKNDNEKKDGIQQIQIPTTHGGLECLEVIH